MKRKAFLFLAFLLCVSIGWTLGFLRLPIVDVQHSFWVGGLAGAAAILLLVVLVQLIRASQKLSRSRRPQEGKARRILVLGLSVLLIAAITLGGFGFQWSQKTLREQRHQLEQQAQIIESIKTSNPSQIMEQVLQEMVAQLKSNPDSSLSATTRKQIIELSQAFRPYPYWQGDSLTPNAYSPERGQLLQALLALQIDSSSLQQILNSADFSNADLQNANLQGKNLTGIHMPNALLRDANLEGATFSQANLEGCELWGLN
ncbi:pentapeptide repeat-containing protein [bacterium SCSIO 12741]|nr:pentapeptide repeat-containing protein [bacterium SCSIO 12741]